MGEDGYILSIILIIIWRGTMNGIFIGDFYHCMPSEKADKDGTSAQVHSI